MMKNLIEHKFTKITTSRTTIKFFNIRCMIKLNSKNQIQINADKNWKFYKKEIILNNYISQIKNNYSYCELRTLKISIH